MCCFFVGVGLERPLPSHNECWPRPSCGHLTGPAAEEEHTGHGLGKVLQLGAFTVLYYYVIMPYSFRYNTIYKML